MNVQPIKSLFLLILTLGFIPTLAQHKLAGKITDVNTGAPLAFVSVTINHGNEGTYTDIDGKYTIEITRPIKAVTFTYMGYESISFSNPGQSQNAQLRPSTFDMGEALILPGENPAHRIIDLVIDNKKINDPEKVESFSCETYNKFIFTLDPDSALMNDEQQRAQLDSGTQEIISFIETQHLLMMESVTERKFKRPDLLEETVIANRFSGFKDPQFALLASQMQSFSFYKELITVGEFDYLSPISNGATRKYLFILQDTTYRDSDTIFHIAFQPRSGKNFEGLKGMLHINTDGYAIQHVIAEPKDSLEGFGIKVQQKYERVDGEHWFPVQLNSFLSLPIVEADEFELAGIGKTYLYDFVVNSEIKRREFDDIILSIEQDAGRKSAEEWDKYRLDSLDQREVKTYEVIDSIGEAMNLDRYAKAMEIFASGEIPMRKISLDLKHLMRVNAYEGVRLGMGVKTNNRLSKWFSTGVYGAYGFRDKDWKYGADVTFKIVPERDVYIRFSATHDVVEHGNISFNKIPNFQSMDTYYQLFMSRMDMRDQLMAEVSLGRWRGITTKLIGRHEWRTNPEYRFVQELNENITQEIEQFEVTEVGAQIKIAIREKFVQSGGTTVSLGSKHPQLYINILQGLDQFNGDFSYLKLEAMLENSWTIPGLGEFSFRATTGLTDNDIPLPYLYNARGSWSLLSIATPYAFETMRVNEFQATRIAHLSLRHNFKRLLINREKFKPEFTLVYNLGYGELDNKQNHIIEGGVQDYHRGFQEGGLQIDNLFKSGFTAFGIGGFYRFGAYELEEFKDNIAVKLSAKFSL